ncbi:universal stress protein [Nocardia sp. No.11]|uniref:universal stress protein n=1 Tax=Nocardia sp. No.11 TaxID=3128861 RepID=UPI00319E477D
MSVVAHPGPVVVGVDGSEQAGWALRWAAEYAAHHRVSLVLVCAVDVPVDSGPGLGGPHFDLEALRRDGEKIVASAAAVAVVVTAPIAEVTITSEVVLGSARAALRHRSESARLLVVGSRGLGAFRRTLLGSISSSIAGHAGCAVAVIPESAVPRDGPVVVGVDGTARSMAALAIAFDEAARRGVVLRAVHAWSEFGRSQSPAALRATAAARLAESLAGFAENYPDVEVDRIVVEDRPANAILAAASRAQLAVVGSHGRARLSDAVLGSVAHAVLHGIECPLIIARPRASVIH